MPFTPKDMSPHEKTLLATVTDQTIARRGATTPEEIARATWEAQQTAGEMIWAERGETTTPELEEPLDEYLRAYYERLAARSGLASRVFEGFGDEVEVHETPEPPPA